MHVAEISFNPTHNTTIPDYSINLKLEIGTTERNPCRHGSLINRSHFDKLKVALACICLFYKPTLQANKELGNSVNSTYLDVTCHHTFRIAYNYDWGYSCRMVNDRICIGCHVNKIYECRFWSKTVFSLHSGIACSLVAVEPSEHKMFPLICLYSAMARSRPTTQSETGLEQKLMLKPSF